MVQSILWRCQTLISLIERFNSECFFGKRERKKSPKNQANRSEQVCPSQQKSALCSTIKELQDSASGEESLKCPDSWCLWLPAAWSGEAGKTFFN